MNDEQAQAELRHLTEEMAGLIYEASALLADLDRHLSLAMGPTNEAAALTKRVASFRDRMRMIAARSKQATGG